MNHHIDRWHSLTLSPADRAILDQMEEEMGELAKYAGDIGVDGATFENYPADRREYLIRLHNWRLTHGKPEHVPLDIWLLASNVAPDIRMMVPCDEVVTDILGMMDDEIRDKLVELLMDERRRHVSKDTPVTAVG